MPKLYPIPSELLQSIVNLLNSLPAHQSRIMLNELESIVVACDAPPVATP